MAKDSNTWAVIGSIPILGFILVYATGNQKDRLAKFHAGQGLFLGVASIVLQSVLWMLVFTIPLAMLVGPVTLVLWVINLINASQGKMTPTPLIGKFANKLGL